MYGMENNSMCQERIWGKCCEARIWFNDESGEWVVEVDHCGFWTFATYGGAKAFARRVAWEGRE